MRNNAPEAFNAAKIKNAPWYDPTESYANPAKMGLMITLTLLKGSISPARREKCCLPNTSALRTVINVPLVPKATPNIVANHITWMLVEAYARITIASAWKMKAIAHTFLVPMRSPRNPPNRRPAADTTKV